MRPSAIKSEVALTREQHHFVFKLLQASKFRDGKLLAEANKASEDVVGAPEKVVERLRGRWLARLSRYG
jgi:hypothetical protein